MKLSIGVIALCVALLMMSEGCAKKDAADTAEFSADKPLAIVGSIADGVQAAGNGMAATAVIAAPSSKFSRLSVFRPLPARMATGVS